MASPIAKVSRPILSPSHGTAARPARAVADLTAAIRLSRAAPSLAGGWLPRAHLQLAHSLVLTGDWAAAAVHARLASGLVDEEDLIWVRAQTEGIRARLAGCVDGDWAAAEAHLGTAGEARSAGSAAWRRRSAR